MKKWFFLYENNLPKDHKSKISVAVSFAAKPWFTSSLITELYARARVWGAPQLSKSTRFHVTVHRSTVRQHHKYINV